MLTDERRQQGQEMRESLTQWLGELWDMHLEEIIKIAENNGGKTTVNFCMELDVTGAASDLRGTMEFKEIKKYADSRERRFGDPDPAQEKFGFGETLNGEPAPEVGEEPGEELGGAPELPTETPTGEVVGGPPSETEEKPKKRRKKKDEPAAE